MADKREPIQRITDSQQIEKIESLKRKKAGLAGSVTRNYALLVAAVNDNDLVAATSAYETIKTSFKDFCETHENYIQLLGSDDQDLVLKAQNLYDETIQRMNTSHKSYGTLLKADHAAPLIKSEPGQSHDDEDALQSTVTPGDSASQISRYSSRSRSSRASRTSSITSSLAKAAAHTKQLQVKAKLLAETQALRIEAQAQELKAQQVAEAQRMKVEQAELNAELAAAEAYEEELKKHSPESVHTAASAPAVVTPRKTLTFNATPTTVNQYNNTPCSPNLDSSIPNVDSTPTQTGIIDAGVVSSTSNVPDQTSLLAPTNIMLDMLVLSQTKLPSYDGNPLTYYNFVGTFDSTVQITNVGDQMKLTKLLECCTGDALRVIDHCRVMPPVEGYKEARSLLKERFGNDGKITASWIRHISDGPPVKSGDSKALQRITDDAQACMSTLKAMGRLNRVDNSDRIKLIAKRLPRDVRGRWVKRATKIEETQHEPSFSDFVRFLREESKVSTNASYDDLLKNDDGKSKDSKSNARTFNVQSNVTSLSHQSTTPTISSSSSTPPRKPLSCVICQGQHLLHTCKQFIDMSPKDRVACVKQHGLCLNCLYPKHSAKMCRKDNMCKKGCRLKHSSFLHDALTKQQSSVPDVVATPTATANHIAQPSPDVQQ